MTVQYRTLDEADLSEATDVFLTALNDMARRNGLPAPTSYTHEYVYPRFAYLRRTGIFRVAETGGKIVSICSALVRGELWFLSMFWTLPEWQQRGIGRPLLEQVWQQGRAEGALVHFTWSSIDFAALATYMHLGMLPVCQIFTFAGKPKALAATPPSYAVEPLEQATASELDAGVLGADRARDHEFWSAGSGAQYQVRLGEERVGYFYVQSGTIGPAAWSDPQHAEAVINLALREASQQASEVRLMTTAANRSGLQAALRAGLRIATTAHLLASAPLGAIDRYLPSGPALF